jgi:hypothetical protein
VLRSNAAQPGPLDLDAQPVVCPTTDFATDTFTLRAYVDAFSVDSVLPGLASPQM